MKEVDFSSKESGTHSMAPVWVADEEADVRSAISEVLRNSGFEVDSVGAGSKAWDEIQSNIYDIIIKDSDMGRLIGMELIKRIQNSHKSFPVLLTSGKMPPQEPDPDLPGSGITAKPFGITDLLDLVRAILNGNEPGVMSSPAMISETGRTNPV